MKLNKNIALVGLMQPIGKRKLERFSLEVPAKIEVISTGDDKERLDLMTSNISSGGAYFKAAHPLPAGTEIRVDFVLPLDMFKNRPSVPRQVQIHVTGKVLRAEPDGMGVCFDEDYQMRAMKEGDGSQT